MAWENDALQHFIDPAIVWAYRVDLLRAFWLTIELAAVSFFLSILPALLIAITRCYGPHILAPPLVALVTVVRSVPAVVAVVFIYFALPFAGITLNAFFSVVLTLTAVQTVYMSEIFRGSLLSLDSGQFEAGFSLGLRTPAILRHIVLPQTFAVAAPAFASSVIQLVQNTTIASVVALPDLLGEALNVQTVTGSSAAVMASALLYLLLLLPLVRIVRLREKQMSRIR